MGLGRYSSFSAVVYLHLICKMGIMTPVNPNKVARNADGSTCIRYWHIVSMTTCWSAEVRDIWYWLIVTNGGGGNLHGYMCPHGLNACVPQNAYVESCTPTSWYMEVGHVHSGESFRWVGLTRDAGPWGGPGDSSSGGVAEPPLPQLWPLWCDLELILSYSLHPSLWGLFKGVTPWCHQRTSA